MPAESDELTLAAEFPTPEREQWLELARGVLAKSGVDGDPEDALAYTTYDEIVIKPLYTRDDPPPEAPAPGQAPFVRGATADGVTLTGWDIRTRHAGADAEDANRAILQDLETGATSLWLDLGPGGLRIEDLPTVLDGVHLELAPVVLDAGTRARQAAQAYLSYAGQRGVDSAQLRGSLGIDPIGVQARSGQDADLTELHDSAIIGAASGLRSATVDATIYHDAGASDAQELGIGTAVALAYLRAQTEGGRSLEQALEAIEFRWAVTADQFVSIAKLRAARRIWDRVAELCDAPQARRGQYQHAVTSAAMLTRRDPWVNMLRTTIGCFAAAVGGADAITVAPFDSAIGISDDFARRIARNTQSVLHDESSLGRVIDAAGGSWYVESLTEQLAQRAWDVFTGIERAGGAQAALAGGTIGDLLAQTRDKRDADLAHRRAAITGVSEFAFVDEPPVERAPLPEPAGAGGMDGAGAAGTLPRLRYAQQFEALRDRCDAVAAAGSRPRVYLATLGPLAVHSARSGFAANLFQAGGLECVSGPVAEFAGSGSPASSVVCLCSSDKLYAEQAESAAAELKAAGAREVWLAGKGNYVGVDRNIHAGCDALGALRAALELLEVSA